MFYNKPNKYHPILENFWNFTQFAKHILSQLPSSIVHMLFLHYISFMKLGDVFFKYYRVRIIVLHQLQMNLRQIEQEDVLTNVLVRSKKILNDGVQLQLDSKLNYKRIYDNPKQYQISYVDALANLQEIKELFKKRISDKNVHYNFFLDDSEDPNRMQEITPDQFAQYQMYLKSGKVFAYTLKDTWTKGKEFFFIQKGCVLQVKKLYDDRIFADVEYKHQIGLMKMEELKIILTNDEN